MSIECARKSSDSRWSEGCTAFLSEFTKTPNESNPPSASCQTPVLSALMICVYIPAPESTTGTVYSIQCTGTASEAIPAAAEDAVSTPSTVSLPSPMSPSPEEQGSGPSQPVPGCGATSGEEGDGQLPAGQASSPDRVDDVVGAGVDSQVPVASGPVPRPRPTVRPQSSPRAGTQAQRRVLRAEARAAASREEAGALVAGVSEHSRQ